MLKRSLTVVLAILLFVLLAAQARSLYVFPVPDSIRWFGDESWLMTESIATVQTGELHHPLALSSTLAVPKSFILINTPWLRTLVYGVPAYLSFPRYNPVDVGRTVSFIIGLLTLGALGLLVYKRTRDLTLSLTAVLLLASSQAYIYATHSARFDILTGSIVLCIGAWVTSSNFLALSSMKRFTLFTCIALILSMGLPVHLYFQSAGLGVIALMVNEQWKRSGSWRGILLGVLAALVAALLVHLLMSGHLSLWDSSSHRTEFADVTRDIPILKLFSLSSQRSVISKNAELVWREAPWLLIALPFLLWSALARRSHAEYVSAAALVALAIWYFFQRPHPAYLIHVLPLCTFALALGVKEIHSQQRRMHVVFQALAIVVASVSLLFLTSANEIGGKLTHNGDVALAALRSRIETNASTPLVMVEASATKHFLTDTSLRLMTTHFQFFPSHKESIDETLTRNGVDYAILFNTANYGYDRNTIDPLVRTIKARGDLVDQVSGSYFDIGLDYASGSMRGRSTLDTFFLYRIRK